MASFLINEKKIDVFLSESPSKPVIYLNAYGDEGKEIYRLLKESHCPDFSLVSISGLSWNRDMTPYDAPALSSIDEPFLGGANEYLSLLINKIIPESEKMISGIPIYRVIAGYSLAGLFAIYATTQSDSFSRVASISPSLWYPGIKDFLFAHPPIKMPDCLYFSLGDKESKTRNPILKCVEDNTEAIASFYRGKGIKTIYELNPGNHFFESMERTAKGLRKILEAEPARI